MNPTSLLSSSAAVPSNGPDGEPRPRDSAEAAHQFESLLVAQMLRTARESSDNGMDDEGSASQRDTMMDLAEQQFARILATQGGLGIARLVTQGLDARAAQESSSQVAAK